MCNNIIVLSLFIVLKAIVIIILPIIILINRKKKYIKIIIIIDILLLLYLLICNLFSINKCIYNSTIEGIKRTNNENRVELYNEIHPNLDNTSSTGMNPELKYKTYTGKNLYYFNQNKDYMKDVYYECNGEKIYINSFGSSITSLSIAISTLYNNSINPIQIFNYYKTDNPNLCNKTFTIESVYNSIISRYGAIELSQINVNQLEQSIKDGGIVIAELEANEDSNLTCDYSYIVIYSIGLDGKYMIADPSLQSSSYVCPSTSDAYGNVISNDNMNKSWSIDEINNEAIRYYLVKKV